MTDTKIEIPERVGGGNYNLPLHAQIVLNQERAALELDKANNLLRQAEAAAISTRTFRPDFSFSDGPKPPKTILLDGTALTIGFTPGRGGGWTYTKSEVVA